MVVVADEEYEEAVVALFAFVGSRFLVVFVHFAEVLSSYLISSHLLGLFQRLVRLVRAVKMQMGLVKVWNLWTARRGEEWRESWTALADILTKYPSYAWRLTRRLMARLLKTKVGTLCSAI